MTDTSNQIQPLLENSLDLSEFFPYLLSVFDLEISRSIAALYSGRFKLNRNEWRTIATLGSQQPMSSNDICDATRMDKVQVSRAVAKLVKRNLVANETNRNDRRRSNLRLTTNGAQIYRQVAPMARAREEFLLSAITPEDYTKLREIMEKLQAQAIQLQKQG